MTVQHEMSAAEAFAALAGATRRPDPYPLYEAIRRHGNVVAVRPGRLAVVGFAECDRALREPLLRVQDAAAFDAVSPGWRAHSALRGFTGSMLYSNPPDHGRQRDLVGGAFGPRRVRGLRPAIERMADRLLDRMARLGRGGATVDLIEEFASRLPIAVISGLLGFPAADLVWFRDMASAVAASTDGFIDPAALARADAAMDDLTAYFADLIDRRRRHPAGDLATALIRAHDAGSGRLSRDELMGNLMVLLTAGFETTSFLIGHGVRLALERPALADRLRAEPSFGAGYVEEILRYEPPVHVTSRWAAAGLDLAGTAVPPRTKLIIVLAAANRDPRRYRDPGRFDPGRFTAGRAAGRPLSFGAGGHFCLGAPLARLEAQVALPRIVRRFPGLAAAGPPSYRDRWVVRGLGSLPVTIAGS